MRAWSFDGNPCNGCSCRVDSGGWKYSILSVEYYRKQWRLCFKNIDIDIKENISESESVWPVEFVCIMWKNTHCCPSDHLTSFVRTFLLVVFLCFPVPLLDFFVTSRSKDKQSLSDPCAHGVRSLGRLVCLYLWDVFETLWWLSMTQCCQCVDTLVDDPSEDLNWRP